MKNCIGDICVGDFLMHKRGNGTFKVTSIDGKIMEVQKTNFKLGEDESEFLSYNLETCYNDWIKIKE